MSEWCVCWQTVSLGGKFHFAGTIERRRRVLLLEIFYIKNRTNAKLLSMSPLGGTGSARDEIVML